MSAIEIGTPHGLARAHLRPAADPTAALAMCHGAGVGVDSPDLTVATEVANEAGVSVALVEMPYLVAGRKAPQPAPQLDVCFTTIVRELQADQLEGLPLLVGGRSMGARVACRTAAELDAIAVLCLAFPVRPPTRKGKPPKPARLDELDAVEVATLVVQGEKDQFGQPTEGPNRTIASVAGNHGLKADLSAVHAAVAGWLDVVTNRY
ncbi:MAG: alpha/beta hydrolase family protein [Solirubrobacterales bacterium]